MTLINLVCSYCKIEIQKSLKHYNQSLKLGYNGFYCNNQCSKAFRKLENIFICLECKNSFSAKQPKYNSYCSKSCSAKHNNRNKKYGFRRSKLETRVAELLIDGFPDLQLIMNDRSIIGLELDLYFPDYKLAIEFNGPTHYIPIYGQEKYDKTKLNDQLKYDRCNNLSIGLITIDVRPLKPKNLEQDALAVVGSIRSLLNFK